MLAQSLLSLAVGVAILALVGSVAVSSDPAGSTDLPILLLGPVPFLPAA